MMNKEETTKSRYCIQWNAHEKYMCNVLCSLMEHQSLVDLAICCGSNTIHAHKCILAANSPYFRVRKNVGKGRGIYYVVFSFYRSNWKRIQMQNK